MTISFYPPFDSNVKKAITYFYFNRKLFITTQSFKFSDLSWLFLLKTKGLKFIEHALQQHSNLINFLNWNVHKVHFTLLIYQLYRKMM